LVTVAAGQGDREFSNGNLGNSRESAVFEFPREFPRIYDFHLFYFSESKFNNGYTQARRRE